MNSTSPLWPVLVFAVASTAALAQTPGGRPAAEAAGNTPQSFAIRVPVALAPDAPLQRLVLPAEVLVRLQSPGYADVRLFNAQGQAVAIGLANTAAQVKTEERQQKLAAYPILGPATAAGLEGLSLRIEERQGSRVVQLNTSSGTSAATAANAPQKVLGALIDARTLGAPAARMTLDADLPSGQPVTFQVQVSKDLKTWRPLADSVLYRTDGAAGAGGSLGSESIDLAMVDLADQYLRVTWGDAAVTFRGATLTTSRSTSTRERLSAAIAKSSLSSPHELSLALPFVTPVAALRITPQGGNSLVPVRVLGRNERGQPWIPLASTVVYRLATGGKEQVNGPVELQGTSVREIKIEADAKTAGFTSVPDIALLFDPVQIVFIASGAGPFTLAAGLEGSASAYLPMSSLIPGYRPAQENTLPLAQADASKAEGLGGTIAVGPVLPASTKAEGVPTRTLVLWSILAAGVVALGLMAWVLLKQTRRVPGQSE